VWDFIKDFERENKTVILTTHNMEEADDLSDRLAIIDHGRQEVTRAYPLFCDRDLRKATK
jgi:ABC-type multidrug transport system ATPase subunit